MATQTHGESSSDSSDSDSEEQQRLRDAAVESPMLISPNKVQAQRRKDDARPSQSNKPSLRPKDDSKEESWALETTPEFRNFVAKKLTAIMDGCVEVSDSPPSKQFQQCSPDVTMEDDEDFKLFATSIPGMEAPKPAPRKRPVESSSSGESEDERLRAAAVSGDAVLAKRDAWIQITRNERNADESKVIKVDAVKGLKKKKKKKKKPKQELPENNGQQSKHNGHSAMECDKDNLPDKKTGTAAKT